MYLNTAAVANIPADAAFLCDKSAVHGDMIKGTPHLLKDQIKKDEVGGIGLDVSGR
jgi:hypothetical protein